LQNFIERRKTIWELPTSEWTNCILHQHRHLPYSSNGKYDFTWVAPLEGFLILDKILIEEENPVQGGGTK
jgi:hypothetical protein